MVEFQKRGLPHIHLLLILKEGHNIKSVLDAIHLHLLGITKDIEEGHNNQNSVLLYVCTLSAHEQLFLDQKVYLDCFHRSKLLLWLTEGLLYTRWSKEAFAAIGSWKLWKLVWFFNWQNICAYGLLSITCLIFVAIWSERIPSFTFDSLLVNSLSVSKKYSWK